MQDWVDFNYGDGPDNASTFQLLPRGKRHDYFTSCLPWAQKGDPVQFPIAGVAPVSGYAPVMPGPDDYPSNSASIRLSRTAGGNFGSTNQVIGVSPDSSDSSHGYMVLGTGAPSGSIAGGLYISNLRADGSSLSVDLSGSVAPSVNLVRQAFAAQRVLEKDARGGTRYTEMIRTHFGVVSPDARQQRPEYIGGGTVMLSVNPITQTSSTDSTSPQGNLTAQVTMANTRTNFTKSFTEHGCIICLASIRSDLTYQQGTNRMFFRKNRLDYYLPSLSHVGEQAVLDREIFTTGNVESDNGVFGYQEAWADYRYYPSIITGKMRSKTQGAPADYAGLDVWHLAQNFANKPALNEEFIQENPPLQRVMSILDEPQFIVDVRVQCKAVRPLPVYSVPGLVDHF